MQGNDNHSTKEMLNELSRRKENGKFDAEKVYQLEREIEVAMEEFDQEKRIKAAKAADDLSKLVITA